jgi:transcriptional regulator with XRE-family HTH domain
MTNDAITPGGNLRAQRRKAGLSQIQLAALASCSVQSVRLLERNYEPSWSDVRERIEAVLNVLDPTKASRPGA